MRQSQIRVLATVAVAAFALAACGSSGKSSAPLTSAGSSTAAPSTTIARSTTTAPAGPATVTVATTTLGQVLVDGKGLTLYRFDNDTAAGASTCTTDPCASTWPAATATGTPTAGAGIDAAKLTTFALADGTLQLQMDGHPLYRFAGDTKAGDTNGQGIIDKWYAVTPTGEKAGDDS